MKLDLRSRADALSAAIAGGVWTAGATVEPETAAARVVDWLKGTRAQRRRVFIVGNGGSAAVAAHACTDFLNMCKLSATTLHEPAMLTCMSNDYGYEHAFARMLRQHAGPGDMLVAISSSGKSANIRNAVAAFREAGGGHVFTLSGFAADNPLRSLGDMNLWLDSTNYGIVEIGHQFMLHNLSDRIAAEAA